MAQLSEKPTIYYVYDALCGWCYGFSPVMLEFKKRHEDEFNFKVLSGGMVTGDRVGPISVVAKFIRQAYRDVEDRTGVKFGEEFLQKLMSESKEIFSSVPSAMALALFRTQLPEKELEFAHRMQNAIYFQGMPPAEWETYGKCAEEFGLNGEEFKTKIQNKKLLELTLQEFKVVAHWGIKGFPSVLMQKDGQAYLMARGFSELDEMEAILEKVLQEINTK